MRSLVRLACLLALGIVLSGLAPASASVLAPGPSPSRSTSSSSSTGGLPTNLARLVTQSVLFVDAEPSRARRATLRMVRSSRLGDYVHVGPLRGDRFTVTAISDQVCVVVPRGRRGRALGGPCVAADRRASGTPLQDSAHLLLLASRDSFKHNRRVAALRELLETSGMRWVARLVAPEGVRVGGVVDGDRNGYDDDGRVAFHDRGHSVCATIPVRRTARGSVSFGPCADLPPRPVLVPRESPKRVFAEIKRGADYGASLSTGHPVAQARAAARWVNLMAFRPGEYAQADGDRVQLRARINGRPAFACYRVSPEGDRAVFARNGAPGTWRLGRCG